MALNGAFNAIRGIHWPASRSRGQSSFEGNTAGLAKSTRADPSRLLRQILCMLIQYVSHRALHCQYRAPRSNVIAEPIDGQRQFNSRTLLPIEFGECPIERSGH
jgi:hypothetical protein